MQKFFVKNKQIDNNDIIEITGSDVNHIINVLRLKKEDKIIVCNSDTSISYITSICDYKEDKVICKIEKEIIDNNETPFEIDIYQGLPKSDKIELIIQKTTEIGVKKIIPVSMERCVVKLNEKDAKKKVERWQKIAEVAAKQSKRDIIPDIEDVINLTEVIKRIPNYDIFIVAYEEEKDLSLKEVLKKLPKESIKKIGVLVGPEGGIDKKEIDKLNNTKASIITLGNRILRTETAPIVITGNIIYELE